MFLNKFLLFTIGQYEDYKYLNFTFAALIISCQKKNKKKTQILYFISKNSGTS